MREPLPPEQWQQIKAVFDDALRLPPEQRHAVVSAATDDPVVREEALALLSIHDQAGSFLAIPERGPLEPGHRLGPYEIVAHLGGGGMGDVYRARDTRLARDVAVKVLLGRVADEAGRARFLREARAIAALSHPNVLAIHDVGQASGHSYLVTELLAGETLRARLRRERPAVGQALGWAVHMASGLAAAHAAGIVHRDLKPENVFLLGDGAVKILDFGLARSPAPGGGSLDDAVSTPGLILGTAGYLAPEQARGQAVTAAADLFSLGAILFELLTGERAFPGPTAADALRAVLDEEPPPPSSLRPEVPPWLDRVVARCLAKEIGARFESARDLAFALQAPVETGVGLPAPAPRPRRWPAALLGLGAGLALCAAAAAIWWPGPRIAAPAGPREPARPFGLTSSGRDRHPAVSPDGRFLAFTSDRDGRSRIWLQQLDIGRESALTEGPDSAPRFSPDGNEVLFTRTPAGGAPSLYRVALVGGDARRVADDASDGDWSPDGRQVVFLRSVKEGPRAVPAVMVAEIDGSGERELARLRDRSQRGRGVEQRVRWSPDGSRIAVSGFVQHPGTPQHVVLVPVDGSPPTSVPAPARVGLLSAVAWEDPGTLLYSQSLSVTGNTTGSVARIVRQRLRDGVSTTLLWTLESSFVLDRWPGRGIVFDARSSRQNLREVTLGGGARFLSRGTSTDRQPFLSPDGQKVLFSSNRGSAKVDVWMVDLRSGLSQRLTDHPAEDWDPALTPDGRHLLWSSDRSGNFEVWMADADGTSPHQITHDGIDAENPTATPDGAWVVYACGAPGRAGVWRIRPDGSEARRLVGDAILPEVSPDGRYVLFQNNRTAEMAVVGVATVADGVVLRFEIQIQRRKPDMVVLGRARWMPDGRAIAFVGQDETGATGVFSQAFAVEGDTSATRVGLAGFDPERPTETFDVGADRVILAESDQRSDVLAATGLP